MQQSIKKKSKKLINIKTNNFIDNDNQKLNFFNQVLKQLQMNFQPDHYNFLITCILSQQQNHSYKKSKHQTKFSMKKIHTQPEDRQFNLADIDTNIFHQPFKNNLITRVANNHPTNQQNKQKIIPTPKKRTQKIIFQNKRIYDLDKKISQKYNKYRNLLIYQPSTLLLKENKINNCRNSQIIIKNSFKSSLRKNISSRQKILRRLNTQDNCVDSFRQNNGNTSYTKLNTNRNYYKQNNERQNKQIIFRCNSKQINDRDNSKQSKFQIWKTLRLNLNNNLRESENTFDKNDNKIFIPKQLITEVMLSRRTKRRNQHNDFSDIRISQRFRKCFT